eukprot:6182239-Pleurochrysis_carterae.AAC.1
MAVFVEERNEAEESQVSDSAEDGTTNSGHHAIRRHDLMPSAFPINEVHTARPNHTSCSNLFR